MGIDIAIDDLYRLFFLFLSEEIPPTRLKSTVLYPEILPASGRHCRGIIQLAHHLISGGGGGRKPEQIGSERNRAIMCRGILQPPLPAKEFEEQFLKNTREEAELIED